VNAMPLARGGVLANVKHRVSCVATNQPSASGKASPKIIGIRPPMKATYHSKAQRRKGEWGGLIYGKRGPKPARVRFEVFSKQRDRSHAPPGAGVSFPGAAPRSNCIYFAMTGYEDPRGSGRA
jgi:hypothetical protein